MIVKVGNQSFDSRQVPIALVLDDQDLMQIGGIGLKGDSQKEPKSLYVRWPSDVSLQVLNAWLAEIVTEMKLAGKPGKLYNAGKPKETDQ